MLALLQAILLSLIGCSIVFYALSAFAAWRFFAPKRPEGVTMDLPVSVLIPVCGIDEGARENWESFCQQEHPQYEVLFGVMHPDDPAVPVLQALVSRCPDRAKLFYGLLPLGLNHGISNVMHLLAAARHEVIVLADSDIRVGPTYLRTVTAPLVDPSIGIVTCGFFDHHPKSLGAALAAFGRGLEFIPSVLIACHLDGGLRFAIGPTIATRQSVMSRIGGLRAVVDRIGSDYHIGNRVAAAGYRVELSPYLLQNDCGCETVLSLLQREVRWARTIRFNRGLQYYGQGVTYGTVYSLLLLLVAGVNAWTLPIGLATIAVRFMQALITIRSLQCPALRRWLWALPLRDLLSLVVWVGGTFGHRVHWRGRYLRIGAEGSLTEVK